jgi:hypothetical protein
VSERGGTASEVPDPRVGPVESFLIRHVRANPGVRFGAIVHAAQAAQHVPRRTAATHLARLVRFGELILLPDRTYVVGDPSAPAARAIVEIRWYSVMIVVSPDGTARLFQEREFRVVSGQLDHIEFSTPRPARHFIWWCTATGTSSRISALRSPSHMATDSFEFAPPLVARRAAWQRLCVSLDLPQWFRMAYTPSAAQRSRDARDDPTLVSESIEVPSQGARFGHQLAPDAQLRLQMVFPERYPIGPTRCRVRFQMEPGRIDSVEEQRLARLRVDESHQDGLRQFGSIFTLSVPQPLLDRSYELELGLPTVAQRTRWLATQRTPKGQ